MAVSRLEINFRRLLGRCEEMAAETRAGDWRLEKYVEALQGQLSELNNLPSPGKPASDILKEYNKKVEFLKKYIEAEKLESPSERVLATEMMKPGQPCLERYSTASSQLSNRKTRELHARARSRYQKDMREELLGKMDNDNKSDAPDASGARWTRGGEEPEGDLDTVLQRHQDMQAKIAEEMLTLARSLKHNQLAAQNIIREDTKVLDKSSKLAEGNYDRLKVETDRLEEHVKRSCNWTMWTMLAIVCIIFLFMILFIRLFPKPR
ncbi:USE1 [Branchiostoma lanceolatum]|uniref:Vesicle transport protein USE1 n=2 Tax=Branchiostoma lanceolatum TaxID=7740 RepID=A0A8J9ZHA5_BRALA|nr:USE1 [Branchiostoma lanceolatum]